MKFRQVGPACAIALLLAQLVAVGTAATTPQFVAELKNTVCSDTGGPHSGGYLTTKGKGTENGTNGSNYIVLRGQLQKKSGTAWVNLSEPVVDKGPLFANNASSHSHVHTFRIDFVPAAAGKFRYSVRFQWRDEQPGQDVTLKTITKTTAACTIT